jgi:hypothetical protein
MATFYREQFLSGATGRMARRWSAALLRRSCSDGGKGTGVASHTSTVPTEPFSTRKLLRIEFLAKIRQWCKIPYMKTLTVEEATPGLGRLVEMALAGEQIQIRQGSGVVELRPAQITQTTVDEELAPREALRRLQEDARTTSSQAEGYLRELHEERQAAESRRPA